MTATAPPALAAALAVAAAPPPDDGRRGMPQWLSGEQRPGPDHCRRIGELPPA